MTTQTTEDQMMKANQLFNDYLEFCSSVGMNYRLVMQCTIAGLIDSCDCSRKEIRAVTNEAIQISERFTKLEAA